MASIIEIEGLTKRYGDKRGVTDLSFQVAEGAVFGFLGPNGAGKTTTIRVLMALLRANSGTARIAGLDCWRDSVQIKRFTGYAPGEPALDPNLTGGQIFQYFSHLRGGIDCAYLQQLVARLDLDPSRKFHQYSTGNKRKVVLIQAFMHRPRLLILDEPTNGLDPLNQQQFAAMVAEARDRGCTVLLSSHVLSEVEHLCSQIAIIRDGHMVYSGGVAGVTRIKHSEIRITFRDAVPMEMFSALDGVIRVEAMGDGHELRLEVQGSPDALIKTAARYDILALSSHEPSLEDMFLRYYEGDGRVAVVARDVV